MHEQMQFSSAHVILSLKVFLIHGESKGRCCYFFNDNVISIGPQHGEKLFKILPEYNINN